VRGLIALFCLWHRMAFAFAQVVAWEYTTGEHLGGVISAFGAFEVYVLVLGWTCTLEAVM